MDGVREREAGQRQMNLRGAATSPGKFPTLPTGPAEFSFAPSPGLLN